MGEIDPAWSHDEAVGSKSRMKYNYNQFINPGLTQFDINLGEKKLRPSCESENLIRKERGDTEFDPLKHKEYFDISEKFMEHIYSEPNDLIFGNPNLKNYVPITSTSLNECDIIYITVFYFPGLQIIINITFI